MLQKIEDIINRFDIKTKNKPMLRKMYIILAGIILLLLLLLACIIIIKFLLPLVIPIIMVAVGGYVVYRFLEKNIGKF